jgi:hypothetical protein
MKESSDKADVCYVPLGFNVDEDLTRNVKTADCDSESIASQV